MIQAQSINSIRRRASVVAALESNHNGDLSLAKRMVDIAVDCGCDAVKVPLRSVKSCYTEEILQQPSYNYPELGRTYGAVLETLELKPDSLKELRNYCQGRISFIGAPYDLDSFALLENLNVDAYQLDPPLLCHQPLIEAVAGPQKKVFVCAGMCAEPELESVLQTLKDVPFVLLHCVMAEPLRLEDTALNYIPYLGQRFGCELGYLGFEDGIHAALAAYTLGATTIEKLFTVDRYLPGPRHAHSLDREELRALVQQLSALESSLLYSGPRRLLPVELETFTNDGRSLVAARPLKAGTPIEPDMLKIKAPLRGVSPQLLSWLRGKRLLYDLPADAPITFGVVEP
jgi:N,N'-diacetyllegionaminate synthase